MGQCHSPRVELVELEGTRTHTTRISWIVCTRARCFFCPKWVLQHICAQEDVQPLALSSQARPFAFAFAFALSYALPFAFAFGSGFPCAQRFGTGTSSCSRTSGVSMSLLPLRTAASMRYRLGGRGGEGTLCRVVFLLRSPLNAPKWWCVNFEGTPKRLKFLSIASSTSDLASVMDTWLTLKMVFRKKSNGIPPQRRKSTFPLSARCSSWQKVSFHCSVMACFWITGKWCATKCSIPCAPVVVQISCFELVLS